MNPHKPAPQGELSNIAAILHPDQKPDSQGLSSPQMIAPDEIQLPKMQPRSFFDEAKLAQLVQSVAEYGILEPLLVRPLENGQYELVAGERRLRAAKAAGLPTVPIVVHQLDERQAVQVALMENLQREDLNPVEETEAVLDLLTISLGLEREEVISVLHHAYNAKQRNQPLNQRVLIRLAKIETLLSEIGRFNAGTFRSSRLPLLNLPQDVLTALREGRLEYTKGQAIARIKDVAQRQALLHEAIAQSLSLSEIKAKVKDLRPETAVTPDKLLTRRLSEISKRLQKNPVWRDRKKRDRITQLLDELDTLTFMT